MIALVSLFVIVIASLLVTRVATVMLSLTGMSRESARFQARSAFSGAGFTTTESESVVNHPVRRRIIMTLILLGNAGIVSGLASLLLSFTTAENSGDVVIRLLIILVGLVVLWRFAASQPADRALSRVIERALARFTDLDVRDYASLLRLSGDWMVGEIEVHEGDWFHDMSLVDLQLTEEGVLCLGIERADGRWVGAPKSDARFHAGDVAVLYGRRDTLDRIDARERDAEGEMDWVSSQIEFTELYLDQQQQDREPESAQDDEPEHAPELRVGERPDHTQEPAEHTPETEHHAREGSRHRDGDEQDERDAS